MSEQPEADLKEERDNLVILSKSFSKNMNLKGEKARDSLPDSTTKSLVQEVEEFHYDPESYHAFETRSNQYEDVFHVPPVDILEDTEVKLLLSRLGDTERRRFRSCTGPSSSLELKFEESGSILTKLFVKTSPNFRGCFNCLSLTKNSNETWTDYVNRFNTAFELSDFSAISRDQFKCLLFLCGLREVFQAGIRCQMLRIIEEKDTVSLEDLANECFKKGLHTRNSGVVSKNSGNDSCIQPGEEVSFQNTPQTYSSLHKPPTDYRLRRTRTESQGINEDQIFPKFLGAVSSMSAESDIDRRIYLTVRINGKTVKLQVDTASDVTMISRRTWITLGRPALIRARVVAQTASGGILRFQGELKCRVHYSDQRIRTRCFVVDRPDLNLIGLDWLDKLKLLKRITKAIRADGSKSRWFTRKTPRWKTYIVKRTEKECPPPNAKVKAIFCSRHSNPHIKTMEEDRTIETGKDSRLDCWTIANPVINRKSPVELLLRTNRRLKCLRLPEFILKIWKNLLKKEC